MKSLKIHKIALFIIFYSITLLSQNNNPTEYPYGGKEIKKLGGVKHLEFEEKVDFNPTKYKGIWFNNTVHLKNAIFKQEANFVYSRFKKNAYFNNAIFESKSNFVHLMTVDTNIIDFSNAQFKKRVIFMDANFNSNRNVEHKKSTNNIPKIKFENTIFNEVASFEFVTFFNTVSFKKANFQDHVSFHRADIREGASFDECQFDSIADFSSAYLNNLLSFKNVKFNYESRFSRSIFGGLANFSNSEFNNKVNMNKSKFYNELEMSKVVFNDSSDWSEATFIGKVNFKNTIFSGLDLSKSVFYDQVNFDECIFRKYINLQNVQFEKELDLRYANFDSVNSIYLNSLKFPIGKLYLHWHQLKANPDLKIKLANYNNSIEGYDKEIHFKQIQKIYHLLRDNYLTQGDKVSADAVMKELGWQEGEILGGFWVTLEGCLLGWGYEAWRYIIFLFLVILVFSAILYKKFYNKLAPIVWQNIPESINTKLIKISKFDHSKISIEDVSKFNRCWHTLHFSSSVLLGIRFKKEWFHSSDNWFLSIVSIEYFVGKFLYIYFIWNVEGTSYNYIKGILGL